MARAVCPHHRSGATAPNRSSRARTRKRERQARRLRFAHARRHRLRHQGSSRTQRTVRVDRRTLRAEIHADNGQSAIWRMGQDLSRPGYDACRHRSPGPSRHDSGDECRELSPPRCPRSKARSRQAANPRDNQPNRECRCLIDVLRQSKPCQYIWQRQLFFLSPPRLTQIDAPFSSRLSRDRTPLSSRPCLPLCWRHCKWQGPFAPQTLLRFIATTGPSDTLSSLADFPVSPVIRPTLLRRFLAGTRRVSPVAQHVLVTLLSLPPRLLNHPMRSVFCSSCGLRPPVEGSALGDTHFRGHTPF